MNASWTYLLCTMLGMWLMVSPVSMGYSSQALTWSDMISGGAIIALSFAYGVLKKDYFKWIMAGIGTWLTLAPLVLWAPDAASYANDTLVGSLLIICSIIIPSILEEKGPTDSGVPPRWSYNPSSWRQRFPIIILAFMGFLMARYLSAFQLGHMKEVWDPFLVTGPKKFSLQIFQNGFLFQMRGLAPGLIYWMLYQVQSGVPGVGDPCPG